MMINHVDIQVAVVVAGIILFTLAVESMLLYENDIHSGI